MTATDHRHGKSGALLHYAEHGPLCRPMPVLDDDGFDIYWDASASHDVAGWAVAK
jgi:hypothetical protein